MENVVVIYKTKTGFTNYAIGLPKLWTVKLTLWKTSTWSTSPIMI